MKDSCSFSKISDLLYVKYVYWNDYLDNFWPIYVYKIIFQKGCWNIYEIKGSDYHDHQTMNSN